MHVFAPLASLIPLYSCLFQVSKRRSLMQISLMMRQKWEQKAGRPTVTAMSLPTQTQRVGGMADACHTLNAQLSVLYQPSPSCTSLRLAQLKKWFAWLNAGRRKPIVVKLVPMGNRLLVHWLPAGDDAEPALLELNEDDYVEDGAETSGVLNCPPILPCARLQLYRAP